MVAPKRQMFLVICHRLVAQWMVAKLPEPRADTLLRTIRLCIENGERLLEETLNLEFRKPPSTRFYLAMIAQEELAKAFMLCLVLERVIPFTRHVLRAMNDHVCKQLLGVLMDYIIMHWDDIEELKRMVEADPIDGFPNPVASAMDLLRYEKIHRWESKNWFWAENPVYDPLALRIFEGKRDQRKQDAIYVRIGADGQVCSTPDKVSEDETREELERAQRYKRFVELLLLPEESRPDRYAKTVAALKLLFRPNAEGAEG
jgi:AbiV family abortive infection protein